MPIPAVGANTRLVVAKETTYGTTPAAGTGKILGHNNFSLKKGQNQLDNPQLARDPNYRKPLGGRLTHEGAYPSVLNFDALPLILEWLTGNRVTTGAGPYLHTHKIVEGAPQSRSCELEFDLNGTKHYVLHNGVMVNSFRSTLGGEGYVTADTGLAGKTSVDSATSAFTAPADLSAGEPVTQGMIGLTDVTIAGTQFDGMVDLSLDVTPELNLNDYRANGSNQRHSVSRSKVRVGGTLNAMFDSLTLYNIVTAGVPVPITVKYTLNANTWLRVTIPAALFALSDPTVNDGGPIPFSSEFRAGLDTVSGTSLMFEVSNDKPGTDY